MGRWSIEDLLKGWVFTIRRGYSFWHSLRYLPESIFDNMRSTFQWCLTGFFNQGYRSTSYLIFKDLRARIGFFRKKYSINIKRSSVPVSILQDLFGDKWYDEDLNDEMHELADTKYLEVLDRIIELLDLIMDDREECGDMDELFDLLKEYADTMSG